MRKIILYSCLLLVVGLAAGCGMWIETTRYYYSPGWTRDGKIIFVGARKSVSKDVLGEQGSTYVEYVLTIYPSGTGESGSLFDVTNVPPSAMSCSPSTEVDYVAYLDNLSASTGLFGKIVIKNFGTGPHLGLETVELLFSPGIKSFDWSNDGSKLVYCTSQEIRTVDINGTNDTLVIAEANLEFVTWKYGGRIAFVRTSAGNKLLSLIYPDGSGRTDLAAAASVDLPQISSTNTNEVYGVSGGSLAKVDVSAGTPATSDVKASFTGRLPRLSPNADMVVYDKTGEDSGIYILYTATGTEETIK